MNSNSLSCPSCKSTILKRSGKTKTGKQVFQCKTCKRRFTKTSVPSPTRLHHSIELSIRDLLSQGWSMRAIAKHLGIAKETVAARHTVSTKLHKPVISESDKACHYCGKDVIVKKRCDRQTTTTKHRFCDQNCYQSFVLVNDETRMASALNRIARNKEWKRTKNIA